MPIWLRVAMRGEDTNEVSSWGPVRYSLYGGKRVYRRRTNFHQSKTSTDEIRAGVIHTQYSHHVTKYSEPVLKSTT